MNSTQKMIAAVAMIAVMAVAAIGVGFAYTASTSNTGNSTDSAYLILTQGNDEAGDYTGTFGSDNAIAYDTYHVNPTTTYTFFGGVDSVTAAYLKVDSNEWVADASGTAYIAAQVDAKNDDFRDAFIDMKLAPDFDTAKATLDALITTVGDQSIAYTDETTQVQFDALVDASTVATDDQKTALKADFAVYLEAKVAKDAYDDAKEAVEAFNATNAKIYSLGSQTFDIKQSGDDEPTIPVYDFKVKVAAAGFDFTNYRYFVAAAEASAEPQTYDYVEVTAENAGTWIDVFTSTDEGKNAPVFELFVAEKLGTTPTVEDLVLEGAVITFQVAEHA